ncbi:MAG: hypothetical protein HY900_09880 [Deltaproteobacteria bacterium]|nr:hypothetical protein [Deltaproteobacteria bacterium]
MESTKVHRGKIREVSSALLAVLTALLLVALWGASPVAAQECPENPCIGCHGDVETVHGNFNHGAAPSPGPVTLFADDGHDDAGWVGSKPYFAVTVACTTCHNTDLPTIHGGDCATCHPSPYNTLGIWGRGCQQGGCHVSYHTRSITSHLPFEDAYDPANDCSRCHGSNWVVTQSNCLNCHAAPLPGDVTPPVTTTDVLGGYVGPALIDFKITDSGKVGLGRTFYRLDGTTVKAAGKDLFVSTPGSHTLEYWSKDQFGNTEASHTVIFSITQDTTPPTTTSNAQTTYAQTAEITLTATDASTLGVKKTYYRINTGPIYAGTKVVIPATNETVVYTLYYWSEDWSGNVELMQSVRFSVTNGSAPGTIRLIWGDSDTSGSPCPDDPGAAAAWTIRRGDSNGPVVASGFSECPGWSGVNDVSVIAGPTPYQVVIDWWSDLYGYDQSAFPGVSVPTAGVVVPLHY